MGGGGGNSLDDPSAGKKQPENTQETAYTFKTYEDYFIDYFNLPSDTYSREEATNVVTIDYTKITKTIANSETQLSYNGNVFYVVTNDDVTGSGSESDPYVVHSTNGFLYLFNKSFSGISLWQKYITLNSDIILNDEIFDEEGNPTGGDGKVYAWQPLSVFDNTTIYGENHTIAGLYFNDTTKESIALFSSYIKEARDIKMSNVFIKAKGKAASFMVCSNAYGPILKNINVLSGSLKGEYSVAGICSRAKEIYNCANYANIEQINLGTTSKGSFAGISYTSSVSNMENCKNYGNVKYYNVNYAAGVIANGTASTIENCVNYGRVERVGEGALVNAGGIVGLLQNAIVTGCDNYGYMSHGAGIYGHATSSKKPRVINCTNYADFTNAYAIGSTDNGCGIDVIGCKNYGNLVGKGLLYQNGHNSMIKDCVNYGDITLNNGIFGLVVAYIYNGYTLIENFANYGNISGQAAGSTGLIGYMSITGVNSASIHFKNIIIDCELDLGRKNFHLIAYRLASNLKEFSIENCYINIEGDCAFYLYSTTGLEPVVCRVRNVKIYADVYKVYLFGNLGNALLNLENVYVKMLNQKYPSGVFMLVSNVTYSLYNKIDGIIVTQDGKNLYYGSNFSNFYFSWKLGKIGLIALDGRGSFQGAIDEEWLKNNEYEKKSV